MTSTPSYDPQNKPSDIDDNDAYSGAYINRLLTGLYTPGSTFKILSAYAPAIDTMGYTLTTTIVDEPFSYSNGRAVKNWYSGYRGKVTVRKAIADSMNICAVKTLTDITPQLGYDYLCNFGITT